MLSREDLLDPNGGNNPNWPAGHVTSKMEFNREVEGVYVSVSDLESSPKLTDAVRIRITNGGGQEIPMAPVIVKDNFGYSPAGR